MSVIANDLWSLIPGGRQIDPHALAAAIVRQIESDDLDFRTRLLIRDSLNALKSYWGDDRLDHWIKNAGQEQAVRRIWQDDLGEPGFPSLSWRVMEPTRAESFIQYLEELGKKLRTPVRVDIGGSAALILPRLLLKSTDDLDVVDEIPEALRSEHQLLNDLEKRHGLRLTHFQSHYLPDGWQSRTSTLGMFSDLEVHLIDPYDVCLSKLFSQRTKDLDDLRHIKHRLDKEKLMARYRETTKSLRGEEKLLKAAEANWRVLFSEPLPQT